MTFEEAKKRKDYKFTLNGIEDIIDDIRNNWMGNMEGNGDPYRGCAVLEIGYVDAELNVYTYEQCGIDDKCKIPMIDYFACVKRGESQSDWHSDGIIDWSVNVDWKADNWKEQLERDMFKALDMYLKENNYNYDHAN